MSRKKRDPLIQAMIAKLPAEGDEFPQEKQVAWLKMMSMALQTTYGGDESTMLRFGMHSPLDQRSFVELHKTEIGAGSGPKPEPKQPQKLMYAFHIDEAGIVRNRAGKAVNPNQVTGEIFDTRGQDGDLKTIQWASGATGLNGADLTIIAA